VSPRRRFRFVCLALILALYAVSIPWYRTSDAPVALWLGLPDWVMTALLCYLAIAVLNAIAWALTDVSDDPGSPQ